MERLLETPHLARVVPQLPAEVLHRIIDRGGLEDAGALIALATPTQIAGVLDLDLWRGASAGADEEFSAERFGTWLEVLTDTDLRAAARIVAATDPALVSTALSEYVRVFDLATRAAPDTDAEPPSPDDDGGGLTYEVGGFLVVGRRADTWDAVMALLAELDAEEPAAFARVMVGCRSLSNSAPEIDGLDDLLTAPDQLLFDLAAGRAQRRERQGYATPAEARAFLAMSRQLRLDRDPMPAANPVVAAYFRATTEPDATTTEHPASEAERPPSLDSSLASNDDVATSAAVIDMLVQEGVLPEPPRALLAAGDGRGPAPRATLLQGQLGYVHDHAAAAYLRRTQELAFLANALVSGCPLQGRAFTVQEASDAAVAICNLGLENWPTTWRREPSARRGTTASTPLPEDFLSGQDLVAVFQAGWSVLHHRVCLHTAKRLTKVLATLACPDREIQSGLRALRRELRAQLKSETPWKASNSLDVLTSLDLPTWATVLGLLAECPVAHDALDASRHAGTLSVSASAFTFIATNDQIAGVDAFLDALPRTLSS
jgi:hypothetical protein